MATYILAFFIFGSATWVIYREISGKSKDCGACNVSCPVKKETATSKRDSSK